jgi:hypothetical protein
MLLRVCASVCAFLLLGRSHAPACEPTLTGVVMAGSQAAWRDCNAITGAHASKRLIVGEFGPTSQASSTQA